MSPRENHEVKGQGNPRPNLRGPHFLTKLLSSSPLLHSEPWAEALALGWAGAAILRCCRHGGGREPRGPRRQGQGICGPECPRLKAVHSFLWSQKELRLEPSNTLTVAKELRVPH